MMKSILFVLTGSLFVVVVLGGDISGINRSSLPTPRSTPTSPQEICRLRGHREACSQDIGVKMCSNLRCRNADGIVRETGKAPDDMWCNNRQFCSNGACVENSRLQQSRNYELVLCLG